MPDSDKIGKNIKGLREAHGETQKELAAALHFSVNTISKYERGERVGSGQKKTFDYDLLKKFANHYGIAVEYIAGSDLSNLKFPDFFYQETEGISNINRKLYPIIKPKNKIGNSEFYRAYNAHFDFFDITSDTSEEEYETIIDKILDGYTKSIEDTLASQINIASFLVYLLSILKISEQAREFTGIKNQKLKIYSEINNLPEKDRIVGIEDFEYFQDTIFNIFVELKENNFCSDLVDYLIAQMYINQLIKNDLNETNSVVGMEMMNTLVLLKNPYAVRYITTMAELFDE